jgi:hypothetical protein
MTLATCVLRVERQRNAMVFCRVRCADVGMYLLGLRAAWLHGVSGRVRNDR